MKRKILAGIILGLMLTLGTVAEARGTVGVHIGAVAQFKQYDLIKILDQRFNLERDALAAEPHDIVHAENESILIIH